MPRNIFRSATNIITTPMSDNPAVRQSRRRTCSKSEEEEELSITDLRLNRVLSPPAEVSDGFLCGSTLVDSALFLVAIPVEATSE